MFFLKIYDDREEEIELLEDDYQSPLPEELRWRNWAADAGEGSIHDDSTAEELGFRGGVLWSMGWSSIRSSQHRPGQPALPRLRLFWRCRWPKRWPG